MLSALWDIYSVNLMFCASEDKADIIASPWTFLGGLTNALITSPISMLTCNKKKKLTLSKWDFVSVFQPWVMCLNPHLQNNAASCGYMTSTQIYLFPGSMLSSMSTLYYTIMFFRKSEHVVLLWVQILSNNTVSRWNRPVFSRAMQK